MSAKIYASFIFILCSFHLSGQLQKGDISIQGNAGLGYQWSAGAAEGLSLPLLPSVAIMTSDNWLIGATIGTQVFPGDDTNSSGLFGSFARYYFNPEATKNNYFVGAGLSVFFSDGTQIDGDLFAGFNRFIVSNLSIEASLGYNLNGDNIANSFSAGLGLRSFLSNDQWRNRKSAIGNLTRGTWLLGVSNMNLVLNSDFFNTAISPNIGYFFGDQFVLGLNSGLGLFSSLGNNFNNFNGSSWLAQPFARYYLSSQGQRFIPFGQLGIGYSASKSESEGRFYISSNRVSAYASIGANLFLSNNVAFEFSLNARRSFDSNAVYEYDSTFYPEEIFTDFEGKLNDREFEIGINMGVQLFLFRK